MPHHDDEHWMREAIKVATSNGSAPATSPIGSVIVKDGKIIAAQRNQCAERNDPTAHSEMMAIRQAGTFLQATDLRGATLFSTLQPCGMCTMASIWAKLSRVVFGAGRDDVHPIYFETKHTDTLSFIAHAYRVDIDISGGCLRTNCAKLYYGPGDKVPSE